MKKSVKIARDVFLAGLLFIITILLWREFTPNDYAKIHLYKNNDNTFSYSENADLLKVTNLKKTIDYQVDGGGVRVSKYKNGVLHERYFWAERDQLVMIADAQGQAKLHFHYENGYRVPIGFTNEYGQKYRIRYDKTQSPRVIQDSTNKIIKIMDYDDNGQRTKDSNPAFFFPLGFAGGLYDQDTQLLHYRQGDYHPASGHWLAKRSPIDLVDNFQQLAKLKREEVHHCVHYIGDYPHAYLCTQYRCGSLYPDSRKDYFNGTGSILDNTPYFQPVYCDAVVLDESCDRFQFSQCVAEKIKPRRGEPFDTLSHNCFHAVNEIDQACRVQSCSGDSR